MKLIIISGPSGCGKTTLSLKIKEKLKNTIILNTDNYYKSGIWSNILSKLIDCYFDRNISFNFNLFNRDLEYILKNSSSKHRYSYDFKNKSIKKIPNKIENINLVIIEGIFAIEIVKKYSQKINLLVRLNPNKKTCRQRAIKRDYSERGKNRINALRDFSKAWDLFYKKEENNNYQDHLKNILVQKEGDIDLIIKMIKKNS